jgi:Beta propeller domain
LDTGRCGTGNVRFSIKLAESTPIGVGKIPGYLLNQFAIDEHNGYLRFATSIRQQRRWIQDGDSWESDSISNSNNLIVVLQVPSSANSELELKQLGRQKGLGKERSFTRVALWETGPSWYVHTMKTTWAVCLSNDHM